MTDGDPLSVSLAKQNAVSNGCSNRIVSTKLLWYVGLNKSFPFSSRRRLMLLLSRGDEDDYSRASSLLTSKLGDDGIDMIIMSDVRTDFVSECAVLMSISYHHRSSRSRTQAPISRYWPR
jgi:hypothetical protein